MSMALVCVGVIALGFTEAHEDEDLRRARQDASNFHYAKSWLAIAIPVIYCLLDALGTFADSIVLEKLNEDSANAAYELTFLAVGIVCAVYVCPGRFRTRGFCCPDYFRLLCSQRALEQNLPEREAFSQTLSVRCDGCCRRHYSGNT